MKKAWITFLNTHVSLTNPVFSMSADNLLTTLPTLQGRDINVHEYTRKNVYLVCNILLNIIYTRLYGLIYWFVSLFQGQIDALIDFQPSTNELTNGVINACYGFQLELIIFYMAKPQTLPNFTKILFNSYKFRIIIQRSGPFVCML